MLYTRYHYATKTMRFKQLLHPCNAKPAHRSVLWHLGKACLPWGNLENLQSSDWGRKRICVKPDPVSCLDCIKIKYTMNLLAAVTSSSEFWVESALLKILEQWIICSIVALIDLIPIVASLSLRFATTFRVMLLMCHVERPVESNWAVGTNVQRFAIRYVVDLC